MSGDHRRRDLSFPDVSLQHHHESHVLPDPMTAFSHLPIARPRHAGQHRLAASWRAPFGATGSSAQRSAGVGVGMGAMRTEQARDRKQQMTDVTCSRTSGFGYRPLDAGDSGAGSVLRGDAP